MLVEMRAVAILNGVEDEEEVFPMIEAGDEWVLAFLEGVSEAAVEAMAAKRVTSQAELVEISKLFDKVGVEGHVAALLKLMIPGKAYHAKIDENVRLPTAVGSNPSGSIKELRELVALGALEWVEWFLGEFKGRRDVACRVAAGEGKLEILRWARSNGCEWDAFACSRAAAGGHLDVLQWARDHGCPWDEQTCTQAAAGGFLGVLKWARDHGCPWDEQTCGVAARNGHLDILQWAKANRCPWAGEVLVNAAQRGHLDILRWLHEDQGWGWHHVVCLEAAENGHLDVIKWARERGCPWRKDDCLDAAKKNNHPQVAAWIETH
ncbi:hypothetical protein CTAYLR_006921 [Chrysophaeum taylorii]|uniref:Ankyrin repeat protein n=1 Tax=Chrysophaeum taylorii TaxID=2483200 RepID=A0AAD7U9B2_9STRA|nr:hypothetical protein CTAYLR_006921 [Chrysophaeum taylorii]